MSLTEPVLQRRRMSWEEYLRLPEKPKAEWVRGEVVVTPPVAYEHGEVVVRLAVALTRALPDLHVVTEVGLRLPDGVLRAPDLMVVTAPPSGRWVEDPPVLVVEVLSASTRIEDTVRKPAEYAAGRVGQLWIVDPERREVDVVDLGGDGHWVDHLHLDDARPVGETVVGEHGIVPLDVGTIFPAVAE